MSFNGREFQRLARLLSTIVRGSVAHEHVLFALEFVKTSRRNGLEGKHLELSARLKVQNAFTL